MKIDKVIEIASEAYGDDNTIAECFNDTTIPQLDPIADHIVNLILEQHPTTDRVDLDDLMIEISDAADRLCAVADALELAKVMENEKKDDAYDDLSLAGPGVAIPTDRQVDDWIAGHTLQVVEDTKDDKPVQGLYAVRASRPEQEPGTGG